MSRGIKDLRELICVSRLTIRDSDEELPISDDEGRISRFGYTSFSSETSGSDSRQSSAQSNKGRSSRVSPDSGISTNGVSPESDVTGLKYVNAGAGVQPKDNVHLPHPPPDNRKKQKKKKRKQVTLPTMHELPKPKPLPPVGGGSMSPITIQSKGSTETDSSDDCAESSEPILSTREDKASARPPVFSRNHASSYLENVPKANTQVLNFDNMLIYLDATLVSEWLSSSNEVVSDMTNWCHQHENYVQFAHFWLSEMPQLQRQEILKLEYSIVMDQFNLAFAPGRDAGQIKYKDIVHFTQAVFREYPANLFSSKGSHTFLNYLDTLTSERTKEYKNLLTDVRCSTRIKQHAQMTLACRAFCLVSVWSAVVKFYRTLQSDTTSNSLPQPSFNTNFEDSLNHHRMYHAIRNNYFDVIHYLVTSGKVKRDSVDKHDRTLVFTAVIQNKVEVLKFLLKKIKCNADTVNRSADNGNTPLHAAANVGDVKMVATLLHVEGIEVNTRNPQCEDATPLHLAVMHGHEHVVEMLLVAKADPTLLMGDLGPLDIARDFGHDNIVKLIEESIKEGC